LVRLNIVGVEVLQVNAKIAVYFFYKPLLAFYQKNVTDLYILFHRRGRFKHSVNSRLELCNTFNGNLILQRVLKRNGISKPLIFVPVEFKVNAIKPFVVQ
jgi:hypothetical protein